MSERDLGPKEVADALGVSETTIKRLLRAGRLRGYRISGKLWRTRPAWIDEYRRENSGPAGRVGAAPSGGRDGGAG